MSDIPNITDEVREKAMHMAILHSERGEPAETVIGRARYFAEYLSGWTPGHPFRRGPDIAKAEGDRG